jgi:hypothetical protein
LPTRAYEPGIFGCLLGGQTLVGFVGVTLTFYCKLLGTIAVVVLVHVGPCRTLSFPELAGAEKSADNIIMALQRPVVSVLSERTRRRLVIYDEKYPCDYSYS